MLLRRLRDRARCPDICEIAIPGGTRARFSAYTDDVSIFVSCRSDIAVVKKALEQYENVTEPRLTAVSFPGFDFMPGRWLRFQGALVGQTDPSAFLESGSDLVSS